jgi:DNA-binding NtrC family response regulator
VRVLLVDDEVEILGALERLFRRHGHETLTCVGGEAALAALEHFVPDLVISDFKMGAVTGTDVLREVGRRYPAARRILLSGYADVDTEPGVVFVRKPYDSRELLRVAGG